MKETNRTSVLLCHCTITSTLTWTCFPGQLRCFQLRIRRPGVLGFGIGQGSL